MCVVFNDFSTKSVACICLFRASIQQLSFRLFAAFEVHTQIDSSLLSYINHGGCYC